MLGDERVRAFQRDLLVVYDDLEFLQGLLPNPDVQTGKTSLLCN